MSAIDLWTDGGASPNPGKGGWAAILICGANRKELAGGHPKTTNNRMELTAIWQGLLALKGKSHQVTVHTDSTIAVGILNCIGKPKANLDLVESIHLAAFGHEVKAVHVKGHNSATENERAHVLCQLEIDT